VRGPLAGVRVVEFAGIGPGPFCAMLLADMGADVLRLDRIEPVDVGLPVASELELLNRGRRSVAMDLKRPEAVAAVLRLLERADALIEGFRPGVLERLGLGPDVALARNPRLVYGRMTGYGQEGPLAHVPGHDINAIALAGVLHRMGPADAKPTIPLNLIGDFGGGALYLAFGIACALLEVARSGRGQVIDAAMVDGAAHLATMFHGLAAGGRWKGARGTNVLDGGAPWYQVYETRDGRWIAVGAIEQRFYEELLRRIGLDREDLPDAQDEKRWPELRERFAARFREKTRDEWCALLETSEVCFAPVLAPHEAPAHPHNAARGTFVEVAGVTQPAPAPRFSRTPGGVQRPPPQPGEHTREALADWGFAAREIDALVAAGAVR
jgi:alpha-methylacyl-CoA racemase